MVAVPTFVPLGSCRIFMVLPLILRKLGYVDVQDTSFFPPNFGQMFDGASHLVLVCRGGFWHFGVREGAQGPIAVFWRVA